MAGGTKSTGLTMPCILIIVVASIERFAYKGIVSNLVTYLTDVVQMSTSSAAKDVNIWCGVTSMLPLLGAFLADSYWDRYSTILFSSLLYVLGLVCLTSWALLWSLTHISKTTFSIALFCSLYLISIAQGGYNPCLQAFGADQLENLDQDLSRSSTQEEDNDKKRKSKFFQWWYFGICSGSLLGVTVLAYVQDNYGWGWGFAIPAMAMAISSVCFSCGTRLYVHKQHKVTDKPIEAVFQVFKEAVFKIFVCGRIRLSSYDKDVAELELQDKPLKEDFVINAEDLEKKLAQVEIISTSEEPLRVVGRLLPIWALLLMFAVIFQLPATFFTKQGMSMKRNIGTNFSIPPATLQSAITISIILLMPLYDRLIIPAMRLVSGNEKGINVLQRMGIGMCLSVAAMVIAALVEGKRLELSKREERIQLSIFCLLPQYILLGVSDVFTVVGMQEFFYNQVPPKMRSIGIGLYFSVFGVGSFVSAFLITVIELITSSVGRKQSWFSDDMTEARLDNYYWFLAVSSTVSFLLFVSMSKHYSDENISKNGSCKSPS